MRRMLALILATAMVLLFVPLCVEAKEKRGRWLCTVSQACGHPPPWSPGPRRADTVVAGSGEGLTRTDAYLNASVDAHITCTSNDGYPRGRPFGEQCLHVPPDNN